MRNLIPHFIQKNYDRAEFYGRFEAFTMFIDLSGFTPLTETLMRQGNEGAEELSTSLNSIFEPMVRMVYSQKGLIPYFAGDAFTAIFSTEDSEMTAVKLVETAQQIRALFVKEGLRKTRFGDFEIGIKIGLSFGEVEWGIVGEDYQTFYFRGPAIDSCAESEHRANGQDIIIDDRLLQKEPLPNADLLSIEEGFYKLNDPAPEIIRVIDSVQLPPLSWNILKKFLPKLVIGFDEIGEFRNVISIFISFKGIETHDQLNEFSTVVLNSIHNFAGYFKEVDFGDKGGVLLGFFGAPISFENNVERALEFITAVQEGVQDLQERIPLKIRAGITSGLAYTGIVGGVERCQYAAVGNRVNIAARLMIKAKWGEILVDEEIHKNRQFRFSHQGDIQYKGIEVDIPTYKLMGRSVEEKIEFAGEIVGRDDEIEQLLTFIGPSLEEEYNGLAYMYGEAGVGKSRLSFEIRERLKSKKDIHWITCQADQILRKPFNPFVYALKTFFEQSSENTAQDNLGNFERHYEGLLTDGKKVNHLKIESILKEVVRTKSILSAQVGINYPDTLWEQLDAKGRYQNILLALSNFFVLLSLIKPMVIELEDGHWYDDDSKSFLKTFVRDIRGYPIFLLVTSRYSDDGSKPILVEHDILGKNQIRSQEVDLNVLQPAALQSVVELRLNGKVHPEFLELLLRTSNGNPFYLEQIIEYYAEIDLLEQEEGLWNIKETNIRVSSSINSILMARIDRLSNLVKETVKAAAVIGREFEIPVLSEVMKGHDEFVRRNGNTIAVLREQVTEAERGQIWRAMNELRYIFKHSLLREAVYDMQLTTRLRRLHQLIATAIEKLYPESIEERYVDLAFHYGQAEVEEKTSEYLEKAADYASRNFQNSQALEFYDKLLVFLQESGEVKEQIDTLLKKGSVLELIGEWDLCEDVYKRALEKAQQIGNEGLQGRTNMRLGYLLTLKGNYEPAKGNLELALMFLEKVEDKEGIFRVLGHLGNLYFRQGFYEEATDYFTKSIDLSHSYAPNSTNAPIVANLGLTLMNLGNYEEGIKVQLEELALCGANGDKRGLATLYVNLGIVYFEKGDYNEALDSYEKGLALSEELGNKLLTSIAIGCIGSVYQKKGDFQRAMENFIRDLELCEQLGDKQGMAIAFGLIGELRSVEGEYDVALQYLERNLALCEQLGYQKGIAKAVNTMADIYTGQGKYDKAVLYYQRAIEISRSINNKLVLGYSLVEKGEALLAKGDLDDSTKLNIEAMEIAQSIGNSELMFKTKLQKAKLEHELGNPKAVEMLTQLLEHSKIDTERAALYYHLSKIAPGENNYRTMAFDLYQKLYQQIPKHRFAARMEELKPNN